MNRKDVIILKLIKQNIVESWDSGHEISLLEITEKLNNFFSENKIPYTITPKKIGVYLRKNLDTETETRGHDKRTYPVLTPTVIERLRKNQ